MHFVDQCADKYKDNSILITLDDLGQASYTSMHAKMSHDLDDIEGHDLSSIAPSAFESGEHKGYLSTKSEYFIRSANFEKRAKGIHFSDACKRGLTINDDELILLERIHQKPIDAIDRKVLVYLVPVNETALAISAFPNGYFTSDLDPFENYGLANHLREKYGYHLFGVGASLIGFRRYEALSGDAARFLGEDLANLYNQSQVASVAERFTKIAVANEYLFLKYVELLEF